jgi:hypothetical protein
VRRGGLLADEPGLGKTLQVIAALEAIVRAGHARKILVVTPANLLSNWTAVRSAHHAPFAPPHRVVLRLQMPPRSAHHSVSYPNPSQHRPCMLICSLRRPPLSPTGVPPVARRHAPSAQRHNRQAVNVECQRGAAATAIDADEGAGPLGGAGVLRCIASARQSSLRGGEPRRARGRRGALSRTQRRASTRRALHAGTCAAARNGDTAEQ